MMQVADQDYKASIINMFKAVKSKNMKPNRQQKYKL